MANVTSTVQEGDLPRSRRPSDASAGEPMHGFGWVPVALGAASVLAGLGSRSKGASALVLTAIAGLAAVGLVRVGQSGRGESHIGGRDSAFGGKSEVERSITIGKPVDRIRDCWLDPRTLARIMASFATVRSTGDGRMHWTLEGPVGRNYEWDTETVDRPDKGIGWRSIANATVLNEGSVSFYPAPSDRGTVVTLSFRLSSPDGAVREGLLKPLGTAPLDLVADRALRRLKSLVETGEIPTTEHQPAARADTR